MSQICPRCHTHTRTNPCQHCGASFLPGEASTPAIAATATISPGGYQIQSVVARGGMGIVLRGRRLRDGLSVALKAPRHRHAQSRERFTREARALASLQHPRVLQLIDIDATAAGTPLLITSYHPGETLAERLTRPTLLSVEEFAQLARGTAEALHHCHARGVMHRDIKPENIVLGKDGPVLIDFGLALLTADVHNHRLTPEGLSLGTPPYAAPEQLRNPLHSSPKSDCYSYGVVLRECFHRVDWQGSHSLARLWQDLINRLTAEDPRRRPQAMSILQAWPRPSVNTLQRPRKIRTRFLVWAALCAGCIGALLLVTPIIQSQTPHATITRMDGWLDEHGRGTVMIPLAEDQSVNIHAENGTQIRLLGSGSFTHGPIRVRGNSSGVVSVRVASSDERWYLKIHRQR
ncbi:MAG: serine/threonine protein kinase [Planctomycetota bacterium]|nr:MAG: serine/threonine protein kinase [Planctomycetota bacterium]